MKTFGDIQDFIQAVTLWAASRPDVLALALAGSYAREAATDASDIDLILITTRPEDCLASPGWVRTFGIPERQQVEDYGKLTSLRVWYRSGPEVEYGLTTPEWVETPADPGSLRVIQDGLRVLWDPQDLFGQLLRSLEG